jgi:hypothetical protein
MNVQEAATLMEHVLMNRKIVIMLHFMGLCAKIYVVTEKIIVINAIELENVLYAKIIHFMELIVQHLVINVQEDVILMENV